MKLFDVVNLFEEKGENLLLLDVDDTLVKATGIHVIKRNPDGTETALTPEQYAKERVTPENQKSYDYREFRDPQKIYDSIKLGIPIIPNLKIFDEYVKRGWKIGILTARAYEDVTFQALKDWLMHRNKEGVLAEIGDKLVRSLVYAINDENKKYRGTTSFEKKANVIQGLAKRYDRIVFIDDDPKNIKAIRDLHLQNVFVKQAHKAE
jgi:FMN phosphatase YigB (HAD superfamily)